MKRKRSETLEKEEPKEIKEDKKTPDSISNNITWPSQDLKKLIDTIRLYVPEDDHSSCKSRIEKLPWNEIAFGNYTGPECLETWKAINKKIRGYRLLNEVLDDAEKWLEKPWTNFYAPKSTKRHPDYPKMPVTPQMSFQFQNSHLRQNCKSMKEFQNKINVLYEALPKEQKKENELKYQLQREEYEREKALFRLKNPDYNKKKTKTGISFDNDSAFKNYIQDQLKKISKHDSKPMKDLVDVFEQDWEKLPLSEKLIWFKKSKVTKEEPKPRAKIFRCTVYSLLSKKILRSEEIKKIPFKERMKYVSTMYKALEPHEIEELKAEVVQEKLLYDSNKNHVEQDHTDSSKKTKKTSKNVTDSIESQTSAKDDSSPKKKKKKSKPENDEGTNEDESSQASIPGNSKNSINDNSKKNEVSESEKGNISTFPGEPEIPPVNPFDLFAKEKRTKKEYSDEKLLKKWNNLEKTIHKEYKKKLKEMKNNYLNEYTVFVSRLSKKDLKKFTALKNPV